MSNREIIAWFIVGGVVAIILIAVLVPLSVTKKTTSSTSSSSSTVVTAIDVVSPLSVRLSVGSQFFGFAESGVSTISIRSSEILVEYISSSAVEATAEESLVGAQFTNTSGITNLLVNRQTFCSEGDIFSINVFNNGMVGVELLSSTTISLPISYGKQNFIPLTLIYTPKNNSERITTASNSIFQFLPCEFYISDRYNVNDSLQVGTTFLTPDSELYFYPKGYFVESSPGVFTSVTAISEDASKFFGSYSFTLNSARNGLTFTQLGNSSVVNYNFCTDGNGISDIQSYTYAYGRAPQGSQYLFKFPLTTPFVSVNGYNFTNFSKVGTSNIQDRIRNLEQSFLRNFTFTSDATFYIFDSDIAGWTFYIFNYSNFTYLLASVEKPISPGDYGNFTILQGGVYPGDTSVPSGTNVLSDLLRQSLASSSSVNQNYLLNSAFEVMTISLQKSGETYTLTGLSDSGSTIATGSFDSSTQFSKVITTSGNLGYSCGGVTSSVLTSPSIVIDTITADVYFGGENIVGGNY